MKGKSYRSNKAIICEPIFIRNIENIGEHTLTCKGNLSKTDQNSKCNTLTTVMEQFALKNKVRRFSFLE